MRQIVLILALGGSCFASTWSGMISDSACGTSHAKMMAEHKDLKTDRDCTLACVKGGSQYVFVSEGKVYKLANQTSPDLQIHAGHMVQLTGEMKGETITFSKIEMQK